MNTKLTLKYTDAANYKANQPLVFEGEINSAQVRLIKEKLDDGVHLIAHAVGLPTLSKELTSFPSENDHVWSAFEEFEEGVPDVADLLTSDPVTAPYSLDDLVAKISSVAFWDIEAEMERLGLDDEMEIEFGM